MSRALSVVTHVLQIRDSVQDTLTVCESAKCIELAHEERYYREEWAASEFEWDGRAQWAKKLFDCYKAKGKRDGKTVLYHSSWLGGLPIEL